MSRGRGSPGLSGIVTGPAILHRLRGAATRVQRVGPAALLLVALSFIPRAAWTETAPYSVQLHVHGSFSEGAGSVETTILEAQNIDLDVVWWSDHDGNYTHHHTTTTFDFESQMEPRYQGEAWSPTQALELQQTKTILPAEDSGMDFSSAGISTEQARAGQSAFRMEGRSSNPTDWGKLYWQLQTGGGRMRRSLATGLDLGISVFPALLGDDSGVAMTVGLSMHGVDAVEGSIRYYLESDPSAVPTRDGAVYVVPLPYQPGVWNDYALDVTQDAVSGFPEHNGLDNSFRTFAFGVESRGDETVLAYFDQLSWTPLIGYPDSFQVHRTIMDEMELQVPEVRQHHGVEISEEQHMNEFSLDPQIPDYDQVALDGGFMDETGWIADSEAWREYLNQYQVDSAHSRDGLVSFAHPMLHKENLSTEQILQSLVETGLYGADMVEVGYRLRSQRELPERLWVWDGLAKAGVFASGIGVSDSHAVHLGSEAERENNFITWIYADSIERADLIEGMRQGRMYFGDLTRFDGTVEMTTAEGFRMGQIVLTDEAEHEVSIEINGLDIGDEVRTIHNGDLAHTYVVTDPYFQVAETVVVGSGSFIRVEAYTPEGVELVFSNRIHFIPNVPVGGLSGPRARQKQRGVFSTSVEEFTLTSADTRASEREIFLTVGGFVDPDSDEGGSMTFNTGAVGHASRVVFRGLTGSWSQEGPLLTVAGLRGSGSLRIVIASN